MALKILQNAYRQLQKDPVEGFTVEPDESNFFQWKVWMEAPKATPFEGGIFELQLTFPQDFPMSPPELRFVSEFWHPNVFADGRVCISILHPPVDDPMSGELPQERWLPTQTVSTIILSVISILGDPNFSSPANVDASVECKQQPEIYKQRVKKLVDKARARVPSHIKIPHPESDPKERAKALERHRIMNEAHAIEDDFGGDDGAIDDNFQVDIDLSDGSGSDFDYDAEYSDDDFNYGDEDKKSSSTVADGDKKKGSSSSSKPKTSSSSSSKKDTKDKDDGKLKSSKSKESSSSSSKTKSSASSKSSSKDGAKSKDEKAEKKVSSSASKKEPKESKESKESKETLEKSPSQKKSSDSKKSSKSPDKTSAEKGDKKKPSSKSSSKAQ